MGARLRTSFKRTFQFNEAFKDKINVYSIKKSEKLGRTLSLYPGAVTG